jgi:hypothetical protein
MRNVEDFYHLQSEFISMVKDIKCARLKNINWMIENQSLKARAFNWSYFNSNG